MAVPAANIFPHCVARWTHMGFGSYDESEQENQEVETDFEDDEAVSAHEFDHEGSVEFEFGQSGDELIARLEEMQDD